MSAPEPKCDRRHYPSPTCGALALSWFLAWAVVYGVSTPWGCVELDLFPARVRITDVAPVGS